MTRREGKSMERFIITVARETGSGGLNITRKLADALGLPY